jgi:hypothetical protein
MTPRAQKILKHRWWLLAATGLLIAGGGIAAARFSRTAPNIPTAEVTRGEFY